MTTTAFRTAKSYRTKAGHLRYRLCEGVTLSTQAPRGIAKSFTAAWLWVHGSDQEIGLAGSELRLTC